MNIKLIAADLDGTLLTPEKTITDESRRAIRKAQDAGVEFVLCTGRGLSECLELLKWLPPLHYGVCCTGAYLADFNKKCAVAKNPLTADQAREVYHIVRNFDCLISYFADDTVYNSVQAVERAKQFYPEKMLDLYLSAHVLKDDLDGFVDSYQGDVDKFYIAFHSKKERDLAYAQVRDLPYYITGAGFVDFEVMNPNADKGTGLAALAGRLGLAPEQVAAIGDSGNDIPMLNFAGLAVVMENGDDETKSNADLIAPSNAHDGVAWAIDRILEGAF